MYKPRQIRACLLILEAFGVDVEDMLKGTGVKRAAIDALEPLDTETTVRLYDRLAERTPEGGAARCGRYGNIRDLGMVGFAILNSDTWRQVLDLWVRYHDLADHPLRFTWNCDGRRWCLKAVPAFAMTPRAARFQAEFAFAGLRSSFRELLNCEPDALEVDWPFPQPADTSCYDGLGFRAMRFDASQLIASGNSADLERRVALCDPDLRSIYEAHCASAGHAASIAEKIRAVLSTAPRPPSASDMARMLKMTPSAMAAALTRESIGYHQIIDEHRRQVAESLLRDGALKIKEVSWQLGFDDPSSFRRAFRKWTGNTVRSWISQARA